MMTYSLTWAIKESLVSYVSSLEDGEILASDGAEFSANTFTFAGAEPSDFDVQSLSGTLAFAGSISLSGHDGMMRVKLARPQLRLTDGRGELLIHSPYSAGDHPEVFAMVSYAESESDLSFHVRLAPAGAMLLGGQYPPGTEIASLHIHVVEGLRHNDDK